MSEELQNQVDKLVDEAHGKMKTEPLKLANEWISVEDRLPFKASSCEKYTEAILLVTDGENVCILAFSGGPLPKPWATFGRYGNIAHDDVTHWMPLPEPPCAS